MKVANAVQAPVPGGPEALKVMQVPIGAPGPGELLIEVHGAGINRADCKQRAGNYPMPPGAPLTFGLECSGVVCEIGEGVTGWSVGDPVCALVAGGAYADYCIAPAGQCLPIPNGVGLVEAAALPEALFTVWTALFEHGALRAGDIALIHGGASGIGTMAIQMASALGSRAIATAGSDARCDLCVRLGAEKAINYRTQDFVEEVLLHTDGRGVDVVLDMVGRQSVLDEGLKLVRKGGRYSAFGLPDGRLTIDMNNGIIFKGLRLYGINGRVMYETWVQVSNLLASGRLDITPVITHLLPLERYKEGFDLIGQAEPQAGKIAFVFPD